MNYTAAIRQYVKDHPEDLIDVQYIQANIYPLIEYRTLLKIFNRLITEGMIVKLDRGIFVPVSMLPEDFDSNTYSSQNPSPTVKRLVLDYYTNNTNGVVLENVVYTNRLPSNKNKTVCTIKLTGVDIVFDEPARKLISLLNLIKNHSKFPDYSPIDYVKSRDELVAAIAPNYSEALLEEIVTALHFQAGTVSTFFRLLDQRNITHSDIMEFMDHTLGKPHLDLSGIEYRDGEHRQKTSGQS